MAVYRATVVLAVEAPDEAGAADYVSEMLGGVFDWQYTAHPAPITVPEPYTEGDFVRVVPKETG